MDSRGSEPCGDPVATLWKLATMDYAKRDKRVMDLPNIPLNEGRFLLDCGDKAWRRKWAEVYKFEVGHWKKNGARRVNLESLIVAIHPNLEDDALGIALFSNDFLWRLRAERRRFREQRAEKRQAQDNNEGGT